MRRKYYVRWGERRVVLLASNNIQACMLACQRILNKEVDGWCDDDEETEILAAAFVVNEQGFEPHTNDVTYSALEIVGLVRLASDSFVESQLKNPTLTPENVDTIFEDCDDEDFTSFDM